LCISVLHEQKVNSLPVLIHGAIEVIPLAFDPDVCFIQTPTDPDGPLVAVKNLFQLGTVFHHPALDGGVIDWHATLLHEFFHMPVAQGGHVADLHFTPMYAMLLTVS